MIRFESRGSFSNTEKFLKKASRLDHILRALERYAKQGVVALESATPVDTSLTSGSWDYEILNESGSYSIIWTNSNVVDGTPVVILLQYGHGTGTGGWVQGRDFINPALKPIFDKIADEVWKEVTSA